MTHTGGKALLTGVKRLDSDRVRVTLNMSSAEWLKVGEAITFADGTLGVLVVGVDPDKANRDAAMKQLEAAGATMSNVLKSMMDHLMSDEETP